MLTWFPERHAPRWTDWGQELDILSLENRFQGEETYHLILHQAGTGEGDQ